MNTVKLRRIAFGRSGDKGDISNIGIVPYRGEDFDLLCNELTTNRVESVYDEILNGRVERYKLPEIKALNFVLYQALDGGVSRSLGLDGHGKSMDALLLDTKIPVPSDFKPPQIEEADQNIWKR